MKHTPGPWEVAYLDKNGQAVVKAEHIEIATCWHHCVGSIEKQMQANARLIAAAPELLEALQEAYGAPTDLTNAKCHVGITTVERCHRCSRELKARAAIAKATGEKG
jgi:hypothetical protein